MYLANAVPPLQASRRFHARRRIEGLAYVEFGPDNGAVLIDVGEGGLGFQSVMPVTMNQALLFKFRTPGGVGYIEGFGEVAWMNDSGKGGGLRFVDLNEEACAQIREWIGVLPEPEGAVSKTSVAAEAAVPVDNAASSLPGDVTSESVAAAPSNDDTPTLAAELPGPASTVEAATNADAEAPVSAPATAPVDPSDAKPISAHHAALHAPTPIPEFTMEFTPFPEPPAQSQPNQPKPAPPVLPIAVENPVIVTPDSQISAPTPQPQRKSNSPKPESAPARFEESVPSAVFAPPVREPSANLWKSMSSGPSDEPRIHLILPQALKVTIGAAAGAAFVLALILGVPFLRTQVQATANARPNGSNLTNAPTFEVEVADINNRRWILRSGGEAGSPFVESSSRRETGAASANDNRRDSSKSARSDDSENSNAADKPQAKLAKPGELALPRPRVTPAGTVSAQLTAPSIFDGITPPIGSVSDRLAAGGPEAPGIVSPETQSTVRKSALQAAVLVQRVPPVYPPAALDSRLQGDVLVNATIGRDGVPKNLKVVRGDQRLIAAALAAIGQWRYRPAMLAGDPIETQIEITITFSLK